jgi:hypothetical protein
MFNLTYGCYGSFELDVANLLMKERSIRIQEFKNKEKEFFVICWIDGVLLTLTQHIGLDLTVCLRIPDCSLGYFIEDIN